MENAISIQSLKESISKQRKIVNEINSMFHNSRNADSQGERLMIESQIAALKSELRREGNNAISSIEMVSLFKPLQKDTLDIKLGTQIQSARAMPMQTVQAGIGQSKSEIFPPSGKKRMKPDYLEKLTLGRMKKKGEKIKKIKEQKPSVYVSFANKLFRNYSMNLINKGKFAKLSRDLIKANMEFIPAAYVSVIFFTTIVSFVVAVCVTAFFLFFNLGALPPFITMVQEPLATRFLKTFWVLFFIPGITFLFAYYYPSLEKKAIESKINQELPFAVVHMSSISSAMIEPSKIFNIIVSTKEYPALEKEFIKIQNEINVYGYDLVTALRNRSFNSPSKKLAELFNGLATTINSGGNLPEFFEKRSQTLLFDQRLEKEKQAKAAETFMDIYISVVIAAPMILMLLLMMMRISGLGISLSTGMISLIMILSVSIVNILFLTFLHLKNPEG